MTLDTVTILVNDEYQLCSQLHSQRIIERQGSYYANLSGPDTGLSQERSFREEDYTQVRSII
ncbi:MAG: hypothetical protein ABSF82_11915 [Candidatus Bathyarchaeia archaeon]